MRLILHADDFGSSSDTVRATIECFEQGALTSASIMPGMPATAQATEFARAHPELDFGVHLTFVGGRGRTSALGAERDPGARPSRRETSARRASSGSGRFCTASRSTRSSSELVRQVEAVRDAGVEITHVDSHRHMHKLPSFRQALERALPRLGIRRVRAVQDVYLSRPLGSPTYWLGPRWARRLARAFSTTDHFYMPTSRGRHELGASARRDRPPSRRTDDGGRAFIPGFESWRDQRAGVARRASLRSPATEGTTSSRGRTLHEGLTAGAVSSATALDPGTYLHPIRLLHYYSYSHVRPRRRLTLGKGARIAPNVSIRNGERISIGAESHVGERAYLWAGDESGTISIGAHCRIGPEVFVTASDYGLRPDALIALQERNERDVVIGDDVWLGARVFVGAGVTIGDGCVGQRRLGRRALACLPGRSPWESPRGSSGGERTTGRAIEGEPADDVVVPEPVADPGR